MYSDSEPTLESIREAVGVAAKGTSIQKVYLFGSRARGDHDVDSDIDLDVEAEAGFSLIDAGIFAEKVELACLRAVDIVSERALMPSMRKRVRKERVLLYER